MCDDVHLCVGACVHMWAGIHLEKDMSVPFGHTVARTVCLFEILCAPKSVECAFIEIVRAPNQCNEMY